MIRTKRSPGFHVRNDPVSLSNVVNPRSFTPMAGAPAREETCVKTIVRP